ncbi:condensation domain-containing protein [Umezawaea endophytica]|uniref:Condensation domain-containing protein n=1 Tax=Umezawaea endophytica TaxID=1654476 RepID=A0A9X2VMA5_9PSEU|nr:condensation domain-containing protein [Umezawaea endophytica]MCS7478734.1 condensation domain-containing protein [Umezawaea endophytica]
MTEVNRPLSPVERWYWLADRFSPLNVVARVRVRGSLDPRAVRIGLDALQSRHPLLRTTIVADAADANPEFVATTGIPIPLRVVDRDTSWEHEVDEHELVDRVDAVAGPLCRAVVLRHGDDVQDVLLTVSHTISDAVTALSLLRELLEFAARPGSAVPLDPLPAPEDLFPARHRALGGALGIAQRVLPDQRKLRRAALRRLVPSAAVPDERRRSRFVHRALDFAQLDALSRSCKREGATVQGALAAAMITAVARDAEVAERCEFAIGSPVDFRDELARPVSDRDVGAYIATVPSFVDFRPGAPFWPMAKTVSEDVARRKRRGDHFAVINLLRWVCPHDLAGSASFRGLVEAQGPGNLCLSNIGLHHFPDVIGPWRLSEAQFVAGPSLSGYLVGTVNTSHDQLSWNFSYVDDAVPTDRAERIATDSVDVLLAAIGKAS